MALTPETLAHKEKILSELEVFLLESKQEAFEKLASMKPEQLADFGYALFVIKNFIDSAGPHADTQGK